MANKDKKKKKKPNKDVIKAILILYIIIAIMPFVSALTHITNCTQLQEMNIDLSENYVLDNNIDCSDTINWNGGEGFIPVGNGSFAFTGSIDGQGYNVSDIYINTMGDTRDYIGMIGYAEDFIIQNIGIINGTLNVTNAGSGILVGSGGGNDYINNSFVTGNIYGNGAEESFLVGGLLGFEQGFLIIENSWANVNIYDVTVESGILTGTLDEGNVTDCYARGYIKGTELIGGLIADSYNINIQGSYFEGIIEATGQGVGGLIGWIGSPSTVSDSYAKGNVTCDSECGGLIGLSEGQITNTYSNVLVMNSTSTAIGGLTGSSTGTCNDSYWNTETSEQSTSACGDGKTITELQTISTFTNWDFENIWNLPVDEYPCLLWQEGCFTEIEEEEEIQPLYRYSPLYQSISSIGQGIGIFLQTIAIPLGILILLIGVVVALVHLLKDMDFLRSIMNIGI